MLIGLKAGITSKTALLNVFLVSNAFVWYYYASTIIEGILAKANLNYLANLQVWAAHFAMLILSAFIGASLKKWIADRIKFLSIWMTLGIMSPILLLILNVTDVTNLTLIGLIFGLSLGIGMPNCMGYFTMHTPVETRGRRGGMIMFFTGLCVVALNAVVPNSLVVQALVLATWRGFGLLSLILLKPQETIATEQRYPPYRTVLSERPFILYFVPWILFSLVNYLTWPITYTGFGTSTVEMLQTIESGLMGVFAIVGGFLVDTIGRKRMAIAGFVLLGLGYAIPGISPGSYLSWYFHTAVDGIAWGILLVIFVVAIWGDLSYNAPSDKRYAMGVFPFFISGFLSFTAADQMVVDMRPEALFSLTAFFLFLAVLPLIYAPETLPERIIRNLELKSYIEKAQKEVAKRRGREEEESGPKESEDAEVEFRVRSEDEEKAEELAQEYY